LCLEDEEDVGVIVVISEEEFVELTVNKCDRSLGDNF
jgi:hypothetical protein